MTSEQTPWGKILVLDADAARANDFGRCLGYLNYEAVLADAEATADVCQDALAIVVGELDDDLSKMAAKLHETRENTPLICYPEATTACPGRWGVFLPVVDGACPHRHDVRAESFG